MPTHHCPVCRMSTFTIRFSDVDLDQDPRFAGIIVPPSQSTSPASGLLAADVSIASESLEAGPWGCIAGIFIAIFAAMSTRSAVEDQDRAYTRQKRRFDRAYYCERDRVAFVSGETRFYRTEEMAQMFITEPHQDRARRFRRSGLGRLLRR